jgi:hypothetical protein
MGRRKAYNIIRKGHRDVAKEKRDKSHLKRIAKGKTAGQKLADKMSGR